MLWKSRSRSRNTLRAEPSIRPARSQPLKKRRSFLGAFKRFGVDDIPEQTISLSDVLRPYEPPQGVRGDAPAHLALDSDLVGTMEQIPGWVASNAHIMAGYIEDGLAFLGYPQLAQMAQRAEFRKPCEVLAKEATREWIKFRSKRKGHDPDENDKAAQQIREIEEEFRRLRVREVIRTQIEHGLKFGIGHVWVGIQGKPLTTEAQSIPLAATENGLKKGQLERLKNIEPIWTCPNQYNAENPLHDDYYNARNWWVQGVLVDRSRLITIVPFPVSEILKPAFNFGGQSLTQLLRAYVHNFLDMRNSVQSITRNFSKLVLLTDMFGNMQTETSGERFSGGFFGDLDPQDIQGRAQLAQQVSDGQGIIVADKNAEDAKILATPLGGLDALQAQAMEAMASIPGIPLVKLFGIQPTGLNASSDGEIRVFYDEIAAFQEAHVAPGLRRILELAQLNIWGRIDPDLDFEFVHLWQMDEKQAAEIEKIKADTDVALVAAGIAAPEEARERLASDPNSIYRNVDLTGAPPDPPEGPEGDLMKTALKDAEEEE